MMRPLSRAVFCDFLLLPVYRMARPVQVRERAQFLSALGHSDIRGLITCRSMVRRKLFLSEYRNPSQSHRFFEDS